MGSDLPRKEASHLIANMSDSPNGPSKEKPYHSTLLVNRLMTEGSDKETRHFELCLKDSGIDYLPGDSLGVHP
ncbi:MAG TPA: sulfite reductase subunit alpha, partial [Opitutae bacterium]|nr:sulfite reductase subunit alpha [Opitutae bacterium]